MAGINRLCLKNEKMEKENVDHPKLKSASKIPLPKEPSPPFSVHLRKKKLEYGADNVKRCPLRTLNNQAGTSELNSMRRGTPLKINSRHITVREDNYDLDWKYEVFNNQHRHEDDVTSERHEEADLIRFSSDKEADLIRFSSDKEEDLSSDIKPNEVLTLATAITPAEVSTTIEHNRIRNIKRSLKRPSSRELQGLSPGKVVYADELLCRRISHGERIFDRLRAPDHLKTMYVDCLKREYTFDMFEYLLAKEKKPPRAIFIKHKNRACVVNWLMKVNGSDGNPAVIQSACWFLDTILSIKVVRMDKIQLVASVCFWIAQKLHGDCMPASKLASFSKKAFNATDLVLAERIIMKQLNFPTQPVVTHDFLPFFAWQCDSDRGEIEVAASFICLSGLMVYQNLACEYPSVIAAAAVKNALFLLKRKDLMPKLLLSSIYRRAASKVSDFQATCLAQRNAIRTVASHDYEYRAPYEHYGAPPFYLAKKLVRAACHYSVNNDINKSFDV